MSFADRVDLLRALLHRRSEIADHIDRRVLNVRDPRLAGAAGHAAAIIDRCFVSLPGLPHNVSQLQAQLAAAHLADGFEPTARHGSAHDFDPGALAAHAHRRWQRHRWPGRNVRLACAETLHSVWLVRQLERLSLRIWDDGPEGAADRLQHVQALLDTLNEAASAPLVRDARWLLQTAQGPLTRHLAPYFRVAERISASFTGAFRVGIHAAGAALAAGHLRSQLHARAREANCPAGDASVLATTRNSNALDTALLVRDLVPLIEAYGALGAGAAERLSIADAIVQAFTADPELLLTRLDLLGPCTTIEELFVESDEDGNDRRTALGESQRQLVEQYAALLERHADSLCGDALALAPQPGVYSPLGLVSGFCADILSHMALDPLGSRPGFQSSLEDMFASRGHDDDRRVRVRGWTAGDRDGASPVTYSDDWAVEMFARTVSALRARAASGGRRNASAVPSARLFVVAESRSGERGSQRTGPDGLVRAQEHCVTSDVQRALATGATAFPRGHIVMDRTEGRFLASAECEGRWFGVSKTVLTLCTGQGRDAVLTGVPDKVVERLRLTCPELVVIE
jgi:hypothetical protein